MNVLSTSTARKPDIPDEVRARWQRMVDLMATVCDVPVALIMRVDSPEIEVFVASATERNPYRKGKREELNTGLYCETVMKQRAPLLVPDARRDPEWDHNPDLQLGMSFYVGYPLTWPDGEIFGTICVLDRKDNPQATRFRSLISEFQQVVERGLGLILEASQRDDLLAELQRQQEQLKGTVAELGRNKQELEERLRFEDLISELSARFVNVPAERVDDEITHALGEICRFFMSDHCSVLEVLADRKQVRFVFTTAKEERLRKGLSVDVLPSYPWAYRQLVEQGEPVIFSSLEALPPEASVDRAAWERDRVQALLMLPLRVGAQVTHLIGLQSSDVGHQWPVVHIRRLQVLGEVLANALTCKGRREALLKSEQGLAEAERVACLGSWVWDIRAGTHQWSDEFYRIFGFTPQERQASYEAFIASVHPNDRTRVDQENQESVSNPDKPYDTQYRVVRPDRTERVVHGHARVQCDKDGSPLRMVGTILDITEDSRREEELRTALAEIKRLKEQLEAENVYLHEELDQYEGLGDIIGDSDPMKYVLHRVQQVARTGATVLLTGETGTGKGVFAHAIHQASNRKDKPFVHVNCAGLPPNLIESELFGREKGAFTGSTARQIGRFELANGGTLFLDEIGELPLDLQAKLLKVIECGEFERLGSPHPVKVDVRIIASTNRHLEEEIKRGQFRKDLFYRLNVFPVTIPSLRQRREDIPLLAKFYTDRMSKIHGKNVTRIPRHTMKALENYDWPGNVRELMNVIERAVIVSHGPELHLAERIDAVPLTRHEEAAKGEAEKELKGLSQVEKVHILRTLQETGWRIEGDRGAARVLGMNPSTLRARIKKLGIRRPGSR